MYRFEDVKGVDEAKSELEEIVEYLKDPRKFTTLGGKLPKVCVCGGWGGDKEGGVFGGGTSEHTECVARLPEVRGRRTAGVGEGVLMVVQNLCSI